MTDYSPRQVNSPSYYAKMAAVHDDLPIAIRRIVKKHGFKFNNDLHPGKGKYPSPEQYACLDEIVTYALSHKHSLNSVARYFPFAPNFFYTRRDLMKAGAA